MGWEACVWRQACSVTSGSFRLPTSRAHSSSLGKIQIDSIIKPASGIWRVSKLSHSLEAQVPNGDWFTDIVGDLFFRMAAA